jgi:uncharacterized protein YdeI (YjbR/CyaY-like superfamily)
MPTKDSRIDAYIAKSPDFARPILKHIRKLVHAACPDVVETMKWSFPHFDYKGMLCSMAAFKHHCTFGFWKGALIFERGNGPFGKAKEAMGHFGRITAISDLPGEKALLGYIRKAVELNKAGVKRPTRPKPRTNKPLIVPEDLVAALNQNHEARTTFEQYSPSHRREYVEWINEAKRDETRNRRVATAIEWMAKGKPRNWKYT